MRAVLRAAGALAVGATFSPAVAHTLYSDPFAWTFDPWAVVPLGAAGALYATGLARLWGRAGVGRGTPRWRAAMFVAGFAVAALALISPIDALADMLFSLHMVQHLLLMLMAAPLFVLGRPQLVFLYALPRRWRVAVGRLGTGPVGTLWRAFTSPFGSWGLYLVVLWTWHVPPLYERAVVDDPLHAAQHASFLLAAVCLWSAVIDRPRRSGAYGAAVLFVFATAVQSCALGALLALSATVWYPIYGRLAAVHGIAPLTDQQVGGLVMWVPSAVFLAGAGLVTFGSWLAFAQRRAERREALRREGRFAPL